MASSGYEELFVANDTSFFPHVGESHNIVQLPVIQITVDSGKELMAAIQLPVGQFTMIRRNTSTVKPVVQGTCDERMKSWRRRWNLSKSS
jgi:hypothetical protein